MYFRQYTMYVDYDIYHNVTNALGAKLANIMRPSDIMTNLE